MNRKMFMRCISFAVVFVFILQSSMGTALALLSNIDRDISGKQAPRTAEGTEEVYSLAQRPGLGEAVTEKPHRIPPGLMKNQDRFEKWKDKKEIIEQRTGSSKTYLNSDGSKTAVIFMEPVHIKDPSGSYVEIDNRLVPDNAAAAGRPLYRNKRGLYQAAFSVEGQQNGKIVLSKDNISLEITVKDTEGKDMTVQGSQVMYPGTGGDTCFLYTVHNTALKEDIILYSYPDNNTFTYEVDVKGPGDMVLEEGIIRVTAKDTKEEIFVLAAPYMEDREGNRSRSLALSLEKEKGKYIITA